jgi:hypothetical protein
LAEEQTVNAPVDELECRDRLRSCLVAADVASKRVVESLHEAAELASKVAVPEVELGSLKTFAAVEEANRQGVARMLEQLNSTVEST